MNSSFSSLVCSSLDYESCWSNATENRVPSFYMDNYTYPTNKNHKSYPSSVRIIPMRLNCAVGLSSQEYRQYMYCGTRPRIIPFVFLEF